MVVVLEDGDGARDAHAAVLQLVLVKVRPEELLVSVHPDRDQLVDRLRLDRILCLIVNCLCKLLKLEFYQNLEFAAWKASLVLDLPIVG